MKIIRLRIYQPQAHYRIPFTYQRRHTYPIPPYSTVIGFFCNVLGIDNQSKEDYQKLKKIKLSIAGKFESKTTEYIWFRNLSALSHTNRFGYVENRSLSGHIEHIGGQVPVLIDILNDVHLFIYVAHEDDNFLKKLRSSLENPIERLEILHLGRAEDWIVFEEISELVDISTFSIQKRDSNYRVFFWIPEKIFSVNGLNIGDIFQSVDGLLYRLPTFWSIEGYEITLNRHGIRNFEYIRAKLNDGLITNQSLLFDEKFNLPVFLADLTQG